MLYEISLCAGELISIQNLCRKGIQTCPVIRLQEHFSGYPVVERLRPILGTFCQIFDTFRSDITSKIWMQVCEHDVANVQDLVERVWPIFIDTLQKMVVSLSQLTVPCGEAEFLMPTGTAPQQLRNVVKALMACQLTDGVNLNVDEISSKVRLYDGLKTVSKQAEQLLRVTRNFGLEGDFTVVVNIANVSSHLYVLLNTEYIFICIVLYYTYVYTYSTIKCELFNLCGVFWPDSIKTC